MRLTYLSENNKYSKNVIKKLGVNERYIMYNKENIFVKTDNFLNLTEEEIEDDISNIKKKFEIDVRDIKIIVVSSHKSSHDYSMITLHYTGNYNIAELGGESYTLNKANILDLHTIKELILNNPNDKLIFNFEATHHGPTTNYPLLFFEIGPDDFAYNDENNIIYYVDILKKFLDLREKNKTTNFILVGAPHYITQKDYNRVLEKVENKTECVNRYVGHIMPKYALLPLLEDKTKLKRMLEEMINKSDCNTVVVNSSYVKQFSSIKEQLLEIRKNKEDLEIIKI